MKRKQTSGLNRFVMVWEFGDLTIDVLSKIKYMDEIQHSN
jgi:hypothetical protein